MNFDLHNKFRYSIDFTKDEYDHAFGKYIDHLSKINFDNVPDLLKYFGLSFFHDSNVLYFKINPSDCTAELLLRRDDDKEDIDEFCIANKIVTYDWKDYEKDPFVYKCIFRDISDVTMNIKDLSELTVIDTEINLNKNKSRIYSVAISFSEIDEFNICCTNVDVIVPSPELVKKYTNNLLVELPYCDKCKNRLLTVQGLTGSHLKT